MTGREDLVKQSPVIRLAQQDFKVWFRYVGHAIDTKGAVGILLQSLEKRLEFHVEPQRLACKDKGMLDIFCLAGIPLCECVICLFFSQVSTFILAPDLAMQHLTKGFAGDGGRCRRVPVEEDIAQIEDECADHDG
jgi:hypothetical protein